MPLIRGANVTFTSGNDNCLDFVTDGTYIYNTSAPAAAAGRVVKTTISPFAQTAVATLSKENTLACTVLGGYVFTTHSDLPITDANAGLVLKTDTSTMLEVSSTNLWSPGPGSRRQSGAIYNDGTFLYVGSSAYSPTVGVWVNTKTTQMDTSFGSQTEVTLPTKGTTYSPHVVDGDGSHVYFGVDSFGGVIEANNTIVKLSTSPYAYVSSFEIPYTVGSWTGFCCVPPKLYVGVQPQVGASPDLDAPGWVYRINTADMTLDRIVITQNSGVGGILCANGLLYVSSLTGATLCVYDLGTYDRVGTIQFTSDAGGSGSEQPTIGIFGPNTNNTVIYWGLFGTSPGGIQQVKNVYTGATVSTYPQTQQPTVGSSGVPGPNSPNTPSTRKDISIKTGQTGGGGSNSGNNNSPGDSTIGITSTNSYLQASAMGDPHFYGFEGESWFFNGTIGGYYNLFSDEGIQINSLFRYWETSNANNFTAMEEIGITIMLDKIPKMKLNARKSLIKKHKGESIKIKITANKGISVNGEHVCDSLDPILEFTEDLMTYFTESEIDKFKRTEGYGDFIKAYVIRFWPYNFVITQSTDHVNAPYLNIIARLDGTSDSRPHGIIGQTADFDGKPKERWDGEESDYQVSDLWASDFKFNKFRG